jgi:hypothetical protein
LNDVNPRVFTRMLRRTDGRTDGSVNISLRNFVGEGIIRAVIILLIGIQLVNLYSLDNNINSMIILLQYEKVNIMDVYVFSL